MFKIVGKKHLVNLAGILVILNLILMGILLSTKINFRRQSGNDLADPATYQAVFLSNNQIYFGRLKNVSSNSGFLLLTDVYYVKVGDDSVGKLIRLGQIEPHGPKDEMIINKDQILFWENLRLDSAVVQTIRSYK